MFYHFFVGMLYLVQNFLSDIRKILSTIPNLSLVNLRHYLLREHLDYVDLGQFCSAHARLKL